MSILNESAPTPPNKAEIAAKRLVQTARQTFKQNVDAFNNGAKAFWANPGATPTEIATALGADAAEVFKLHALLGQMLAQIDATKIAEGLAVVGQFTMNQDGTVTVTEPAPEY